MQNTTPQNTSRRRLLAGCIAIALCSCIGFERLTLVYDYFVRPSHDDPWSVKIEDWQSREKLGASLALNVESPSVSESGSTSPSASAAHDEQLRAKYLEFRLTQKRAIVRDVADWIQTVAEQHYLEDGPVDHWATLEETLRRNGDDCDGLELLVYRTLRELGFSDTEVFRAVVYRTADKQHHMVTMWFEDPHDPWIVDPTGAMAPRMMRMSQISGWVPIKIFGDELEFTVRSTALVSSATSATHVSPAR